MLVDLGIGWGIYTITSIGKAIINHFNTPHKIQFDVDRARQNHYHAHLFIP
jgi:hypothetical protein